MAIFRCCRRPAALVCAAGVTVLGAAASAVAQENEWPTLPPALVDLVEAAGTPRTLASPLDDLLRMAEILGEAPPDSRLIRRLSAPRTPSDALRVELLPTDFRAVANSGYPRTGNDGLLWSGRGLSTAVSAGARLRWGPVSAAIAPEIVWQQNAEFQGPARRAEDGLDYSDPSGGPALTEAGWGASHVRLDAFGAAAGLSTENMWWGPATRYPLLMSSTAPGFPHLFLGTSRPVSVGIGTIEAELSWGGLTESDHFDDVTGNDRHTFVGLAVAFSPDVLEGLSLGAARVYQHIPTASSWIADVDAFRDPSSVWQGEEMFSLFGRWVVGEAGEIYGEWARGMPRDLDELFNPPVDADVMLGFQNLIPIRDGLSIRILGELAKLGGNTYHGRVVPQGHTNRGQLLGASIGPGGEAQFVGVDALSDLGVAGLYYERVYRQSHIRGSTYPSTDPDVEVTIGLRGLSRAWKGLAISGDLSWSERWVDDPQVNWGLDLQIVGIPGLR